MKHVILILLSLGFAVLSASALNPEKAGEISGFAEVISKTTDVNINVDQNTLNEKLPESGTDNNKTGISFQQGSWNEALALAKKEDKLIFLDISASWCGPCKMLKANTFPNSEVGEFYNANFINVAFDGEKGEGVTLARKYNVSAYPTLLFINPDGEIVAQIAGYRNPEQFIELGEKIKEYLNKSLSIK